jgi:hypothetical protein
MSREDFESKFLSDNGKHAYLRLEKIDAEYRFHGSTRPDGEYVDDEVQSLWLEAQGGEA